MQKSETFKANDGTIFQDEVACAKYELETDKTIVENIEKAVEKVPGNYQTRWCGGTYGGCACMGCVNHHFDKLGLEKAHWKVWMEKYRKPRLDDDGDCFNGSYGLYLNMNEDQKNIYLIKCLKEVILYKMKIFASKNTMELNSLIENSKSGAPLYEEKYYAHVMELKSQIESKTDVKCEIKKILSKNKITISK